ncbi:MAG: diguanylate cyclase [Solirubrobacteraceae bacterium]
MSFRNRLTLFFVVIVVVPLLAVAVIVYVLISDSISNQTSASLAASQSAAIGAYHRDFGGPATRAAVRRISSDQPFISALVTGNLTAAGKRAEVLRRRDHLARLALFENGRAVVDAGQRDAVAANSRTIVTRQGRTLGTLEVSLVGAANFARTTSRLTGVGIAVTSGGMVLAASDTGGGGGGGAGSALAMALTGRTGELGRLGDVKANGTTYRVSSFLPDSFSDRPVRVVVLLRSDVGASIAQSRIVAATALGGFLALALAFALIVSRSLQRRLVSFLEAARRFGAGDFGTRVPVVGRDEFAALGEEFNSMASQLESRLEELRQQRTRLEKSLQRLGDSFASNLDRDALLEIVLRTAVDGAGARAGRAVVRTGTEQPLHEAAKVGPTAEYQGALTAAEEGALRSGNSGSGSRGVASAIAHVLRASDGSDEVLGVISVARGERPFEVGERDLFAYLARQAAVSIENVGLHEQVQRQALTDELTGLYNHRRFVEALAAEAERARRFDQSVGLVMLDLDDFKSVNDTYGHQQGDQVLRSVAALMRTYSREIDAPARYGGEELAIVLPQTDLEGAHRLAERLRTGIDQLEIPMVSGSGTMRVTASLGVAALPDSAQDPERLIAAADAALYEAKRMGKNRTVRAR